LGRWEHEGAYPEREPVTQPAPGGAGSVPNVERDPMRGLTP
jgi:hypothetical protein